MSWSRPKQTAGILSLGFAGRLEILWQRGVVSTKVDLIKLRNYGCGWYNTPWAYGTLTSLKSGCWHSVVGSMGSKTP